MTLEVDLILPDAALISNVDAEFAAAIEESDGAFWLQGGATHFSLDPETSVLQNWTARTGNGIARTVDPNKGHTFAGAQDEHQGMQCQMGINCGLVIDNVTEDASRFSMAVIYLPPAEGDARTLLSVNTSTGSGTKGEYLFLSDSDGKIVAKDTGAHIGLEVSSTAEAGLPRLLLLTLDKTRLALMVSDEEVTEVEQLPPNLGKPASLFVGCRSHRKGLEKTLGSALIRDVIFWPRSLLLFPRTPEERRQRVAVERYFRWTR